LDFEFGFIGFWRLPFPSERKDGDNGEFHIAVKTFFTKYRTGF